MEHILHIYTFFRHNMADFAKEIRSKCTNVLRWRIICVQMCKWSRNSTCKYSFNQKGLIWQQKLGPNAQMCFDSGLYQFKCVNEQKWHIYTLFRPNMADFAITIRTKCTNKLRQRFILVQMRNRNTSCTSIHSFDLICLISQKKKLGPNAHMCFDS